MQLQGQCHPLIFTDTPVIVGLEIGHLPFFIKGIGLEVQPGRVNVGGGNLRTLRQALLANMGEKNRLVPVADIYLVSRLQRHAPRIAAVSMGLCQADALRGTKALRLSCV